MLRVLHLADLHLGYRANHPDVPPEVFEERDRVLEQALEVAIRRQVHLVLIVGDLFDDYKPSEHLIESVLRSLKRLQEKQILCVTVPGNHDEYTYHDSVYRKYYGRWPGVLVANPMPEVVSKDSIGDASLHIVSLAYTAGRTDVSQPLRDFPKAPVDGITIAALHGTIGTPFNSERSLPLDQEALIRAGYHYVALGHIHSAKRYNWDRTVAYYPGMVAGKGFSDPGVGFFSLVTLANGSVHIEQIPAQVPRWHREEVSVSSYENFTVLVNECQNRLQAHTDSLVQISLQGLAPFPISTERLRTELSPLCRYLEVVDKTEGFTHDYLRKLAQEHTVRGMFVRKMQEKIDTCVDEDQRRLYQRALLLGLEAFAVQGGE